MVFKKGQKAWNKGLTKKTNESIKRGSLKLKYPRKDKKEYIFKCRKCRKEYSLILTECLYVNNKYKKHCSYKCSNSRIQTKEINKKRSDSLMKNENRFGKHHTKESNEKNRQKHLGTWEERFGKEKAEEMKLKQKNYMKGRYRGNKNPSKRQNVKIKLRNAALDRIYKIGGGPNIGLNEKQILDEIELGNNIKIKRQYRFKNLGYVVDGYCKETNIVYEIDERSKTKEKDIQREQKIKIELNCQFIRIDDNFPRK